MFCKNLYFTEHCSIFAKVMNKITHFVYYKCSKILIPNSTAMYTSNEKSTPYLVPVRPDFTGIETKSARLIRRLSTACMGREFTELPTKQKIGSLYLIVSLMAPIVLFNESHPWLMALFVGNLANAVRLANRFIRKTSVRD